MFAIGIIGVLAKRNALILFLSIELMLNAANLLFVAFASTGATKSDWYGCSLCWWWLLSKRLSAGHYHQSVRSKQIVDIDQYNGLRG